MYGSAYVSSGTGYIAVKDFTGNLHGNTRFFTGREYDREIGLYYLRARYYDASTGRFVSRDPIGQVDDMNLYGYVGENPFKYTDPMGKEKNLLKVVNYFNSYGNKLEKAKPYSSSNLLGYNSDLDPGLNSKVARKSNTNFRMGLS